MALNRSRRCCGLRTVHHLRLHFSWRVRGAHGLYADGRELGPGPVHEGAESG